MEVDYPRVTHPFAGLLALAGFLPRLACVRHAASVRSEPGSNSPINFFLERQRLALTSLLFTQSIAVSAISFVDLLSSFQRPGQAFYNRLQTAQLPGACCCAAALSPSLQGGGVYRRGTALSSTCLRAVRGRPRAGAFPPCSPRRGRSPPGPRRPAPDRRSPPSIRSRPRGRAGSRCARRAGAAARWRRRRLSAPAAAPPAPPSREGAPAPPPPRGAPS